MNMCMYYVLVYVYTHTHRQNVFPPMCTGSFERTLLGFHALLRGGRVEVKNCP